MRNRVSGWLGSRKEIIYGSGGSTFELVSELSMQHQAGIEPAFRVYQAHQWHTKAGPQTTQPVALKLTQARAEVGARRLFLHERSLLSRLQHPNIVRFYEYGECQDEKGTARAYLALEFVGGETLQMVVQRGPIRAVAVLAIIKQIADALMYLHQERAYHCDLKPTNIMLDYAARRVVLIDFGIARSPWYKAAFNAGTGAYMAPEQADPRARCDGRTDIYALGVILCEMLSGKPLFPNRSYADVQQGVWRTPNKDELMERLAVVKELSYGHTLTELAQIIERCLDPDPNGRYYQEVQPLFDDLKIAIARAERRQEGRLT